MRTTTIASILATALLGALPLATACSKAAAPATVPAPPEFAAQGEPTATPPTPASDSTKTIAPEDQISFSFDSATLGIRDRELLDDVAAWVRSNPARSILVQGHADKTGTAAYNLDLSGRRAQAVATYRKQQGVADDQIVMAAAGESGPSLAPQGANRRVLIYATAIEAAAN
jgi:outer membrane protein OmpA-like peptidoglycan-associated protein